MTKTRETWHVAAADDDVQWIAIEYGIKDWQAVCKDPKNREIADPHLLYRGDRVWIPDLKPKVFDAETNKRHEFVLHRPKQLIHLVLQGDDGRPHGNCRYEFWINGKRFDPSGTGAELRTREDGLIHQLVPLERNIELRAWMEDTDSHQQSSTSPEDSEPADYVSLVLNPAHLDPIETVEGIQDRLANLGYGLSDPWGTLGDSTRAAITEFQRDMGLPPSGNVDAETRQRLLETAGS